MTRPHDRSRTPLLATVLVGVLLLAACGGGEASTPAKDSDRLVLTPAAPGEGHTHAPGQEDTALVGDGLTASVGGYTMERVRLPARPDAPGALSFRIVDAQGRPLRDYATVQTKPLHLYVVRSDLQDFRHLHPELGADGTWTAQVDLSGPGAYRVIAEFTPETDEGANAGQSLVLASTALVTGAWTAEPVTGDQTGDDGVLQVTAPESVPSGPDGRMRFEVGSAPSTGRTSQPVTLGSYLGAYAHVTGFDTETGRFVHTHPYGEPEMGKRSTGVVFHTEFEEPGRYRFFVQVRVDGFVHTVPVVTTVT